MICKFINNADFSVCTYDFMICKQPKCFFLRLLNIIKYPCESGIKSGV